MKAFPRRRQQWIMVGGFLRNLRRTCELKMEALKNAEVHHDFLASAVKEAKAVLKRKLAAFQAHEEGIFPSEKNSS